MLRSNSYPKYFQGIRAIICTFLLLFVSPLSANNSKQDELTKFLQEIQAASDQIHSFSSSFVQEKHLALFTQPVIFNGKLTVVRPNKLRWEFSDPVPSALIFNGNQGIRCNDQGPPARFDLGSDPVMRVVAEQLWLWLGGDYKRLNDLYLVEKINDFQLLARPRDESMATYVGDVIISFADETRQVVMVEIKEPGGDLTRIKFHSYTLNGDVPDSLFGRCEKNDG